MDRNDPVYRDAVAFLFWLAVGTGFVGGACCCGVVLFLWKVLAA